jgi:dTDP-glucose 4,6-dehydratase
VHHDFRYPLTDAKLKEIGVVDYVIHNGAESHVARSFKNPGLFVESNVLGTLNMLEAARKLQPKTFLYVSTDEVFGPADPQHGFHADDRLAPTNPYAASKAGGELLAYGYFRSFGLPVIISHTMNMFGERQHPEKCVPLMIKRMLCGRRVQVHGRREDIHGVGYAWVSGSRHWLHAHTQAEALTFLLNHGKVGEKYNIGGIEKSNMEIAELIASILGARPLFDCVVAPEPVHDFSYRLRDDKIKKLGWVPLTTFETEFIATVRWFEQNQSWLGE